MTTDPGDKYPLGTPQNASYMSSNKGGLSRERKRGGSSLPHRPGARKWMSNKQGNDSIGFSAAVNLRWSRSHRIFVFPRWVPRVIPCDLTQQTLLRMANVNSDIMKVSRIGWSSRLPIPLSTTLPPPFSIRTRLGSLEPPSREGNTSPVGPPDVLPPFPSLLCFSRGTDLYRRFRTRCESNIPAVADPGLLFPEPFPQTRTPAPGPVQSPWTSVPYDFIQSHLRPPMTPAAKRKADITTGPPVLPRCPIYILDFIGGEIKTPGQ